MPMHSDRTRVRGRRSKSELDRFLEEPWDEPTREAFAADDDEWYPELFADDEDRLEDLDLEDEDLDLDDDPADAWGPIRKRRRLRDDDDA